MGVPILESTDIKAGDSETLDAKAMAFAGECLRKVQQGGAEAVAEYAQRFGAAVSYTHLTLPTRTHV